MGEDCVVLWRDRNEERDLCFEIVQIGEGVFELRILCDGQLWLEEDSNDLHSLIERANNLHVDVHPTH